MNTVIAIPNYSEDISLILAINRFGLKDEVHNTPIIINSNGADIIAHQFSLSKDLLSDNKVNFAINKYNCFATITYQCAMPEQNAITTASNCIKKLMQCSSIEDMTKTLSLLDPNEHSLLNIIFGNAEKVFHAQYYLFGSLIINQLENCVNIISDEIRYPQISSRRAIAHKVLDNRTNWLEYYINLKKVLKNTKYGFLTKCSNKLPAHTKSSTIITFSKKGIRKYSFFLRDGNNLKYSSFSQLKYGFQ